MADEIINKLGFDVNDALSAIERLDRALKSAGESFNTFGTAIDNWNSRAAAALATMRGLASAAKTVATSMQGANAAPAAQAATPQQPAASKLWLPPGFQSQAQQAQQAMAGVGQAGQAAGQKIVTGMNKASNATKNARQKADKFIVSWNTIGRVVVTQLIVRTMSMIRDSIKGATESAIQFQKSIAEIHTIVPTIGGEFTSLTREAAEFSKSFNIPLPQVSEGLYQSISNQFASVSERSRIMTASMKLAKVGVMDFQDSVNLLTGTLNAYGTSSGQAEAVAAKFFNTIRLGRIRGKELSDTIGRVIPFASQLGVSLDELNADIVSMTIGGLDAHKTMTSLRSVMVGLLKPSEDMKKVVRNLGFGTPEQLIAAKGFQGALQTIADASDNMGSEIVKSFRNIRALTAELRLTQTGAEQVQGALEAMAQSTPDSLNKIFEEFRAADAERLTRSLNQVKVTLIEDLGSAIIRTLNWFISMAGGAENLAAATQSLAMAAVPLAAALTGVGLAFAFVNISMGPIGWAISGVTAALMAFVGVSTFVSATHVANIRRMANEQRQATMEYLKNLEEQKRKALQAEMDELRESNRNWENRASKIRRDYFHVLDQLKDKNKEIIESDRAVMQSMVASQQRVVSAYRRAANESLRAVQESQKRQIQGEAQYSDAVFKYSTKRRSASEKANEYMRRSRQLAQQAADALAKAKTPEQVQMALAAQQRAEAAANEAQSIADGTNNISLQDDAQHNLLGIIRQRVGAERQLQTVQARQAQEAAKTAAREQDRVNKMKVATKGVLDNLNAFNKQGAKTPEQLAKQSGALHKSLADLRKLWLGGKQVNISDMLAMDKLQQRVETAIEGGVSDVEVKRLFAEETTFAKFRQDIESGVGPIRLLIETVKAQSPQLSKEMEGMNTEEAMSHLSQALQKSPDWIEKYRQMSNDLDTTNQALARLTTNARNDLKTALDESLYSLIGFRRSVHVATDKKDFNRIRNTAKKFTEEAQSYLTQGMKANEKDYVALNEAYKNYVNALGTGQEPEVLKEFMKDAQLVAEQAQRAKTLQKGMEQIKARAGRAGEEVPLLNRALDAAERQSKKTASAAERAAIGTRQAADNLANAAKLDLGGLVGQINQAARGMQSLAVASANVQMPSGTFTAAKGGAARYLAAGGSAGTDVIPAMLSPNEFVMNAASTRKFASQLVAMNAGVQPVFRSEGGSVTNVGDINVTVSGGGTGRQTARNIAAELRRELRRGTSTL